MLKSHTKQQKPHKKQHQTQQKKKLHTHKPANLPSQHKATPTTNLRKQQKRPYSFKFNQDRMFLMFFLTKNPFFPHCCVAATIFGVL